MRLLRTDRFELKNFSDDEIKRCPYVILSHCWAKDATEEVSIQDIDLLQKGTIKRKSGLDKLEGAMKQAKHDGYEWIWIDTCCIDKSSSSELTEAINSMFAWYARAALCYAYIEDDTVYSVAELELSKWFTRSWTLQELIGSRELVFFNRKWMSIGSKKDRRIYEVVSKRTHIDESILIGKGRLDSVSVAKRMSWAAQRKATRQEDEAYSLMGIFGVNMPMLYGEGATKAFHRLQEQIMKDSNDHSIFAWRSIKGDNPRDGHGLLADSPNDFAECSNIISYNDFEQSVPYQPSNQGLRIELRLTDLGDGTFAAALNCPIPSPQDGYHGFIGIKLKKLPIGVEQYARISCESLVGLTKRSDEKTTIYVRQAAPTKDFEAILPLHFFQLRGLYMSDQHYELLGAAHYPLEQHERVNAPRPLMDTNRWVAADTISSFKIIKRTGRLSAALGFRRKSDELSFTLLLGCRTDLEIGFDVASKPYMNMKELEEEFDPRAPGEWIEIGPHRVRVDATQILDVPRKLYMIDITITASSRWDLPNPYDLSRPLDSTAIRNDVLDYLVDRTQSVAHRNRSQSQARVKCWNKHNDIVASHAQRQLMAKSGLSNLRYALTRACGALAIQSRLMLLGCMAARDSVDKQEFGIPLVPGLRLQNAVAWKHELGMGPEKTRLALDRRLIFLEATYYLPGLRRLQLPKPQEDASAMAGKRLMF